MCKERLSYNSKRKSNQSTVQPLFCFLFLGFLVAWSAANSMAIRREHPIDSWRPEHYNVTLTLNEQLTELVSANAEISIVTLKKTSLIDLDFGNLTTDSVTVDRKPAQFEHRDGKLQVKLNGPLEAGTKLMVSVAYHGRPSDGLVLTADKDGAPSAIGDNWPDRVHHWIPCRDHPSAKATVTFNVTAPSRYLVVANGLLEHVETREPGTTTWSYVESVRIPPYCMIIAVGQFARFESIPAVSPLSYYVPVSDRDYALKGFAPAANVLKLFSQNVAPYPYEKLALIIGATRFGGMENSSAIVFASTLFNPNPAAKLSPTFGIPANTMDVVAHEIAHQWFGDSVTESTWADLWLSEGFATYFAGYFIEQTDGEDAFQEYMERAREAVVGYEQKGRPPIFDRDTEDLFKLLNANNYQKGAWVLHMLRSRLGDAAFFGGIRAYYQGHKESVASSEDLRMALEKSSGKDLGEFFRRWVYDSGHPQYRLLSTWNSKRGTMNLVLIQQQAGSPFLDPVPLRILTADGALDLTLSPTGKTTRKLVRLKTKPTTIEIDPRNTLLKEAIVTK
jgi:aminopeptidase N